MNILFTQFGITTNQGSNLKLQISSLKIKAA
jgi:hypothetical protein